MFERLRRPRPTFLFQNYVLHPLIKSFDPYIEGLHQVTTPIRRIPFLKTNATTTPPGLFCHKVKQVGYETPACQS